MVTTVVHLPLSQSIPPFSLFVSILSLCPLYLHRSIISVVFLFFLCLKTLINPLSFLCTYQNLHSFGSVTVFPKCSTWAVPLIYFWSDPLWSVSILNSITYSSASCVFASTSLQEIHHSKSQNHFGNHTVHINVVVSYEQILFIYFRHFIFILSLYA